MSENVQDDSPYGRLARIFNMVVKSRLRGFGLVKVRKKG